MKTKRFLSTLLALLLVCSLPVSAFAEEIGDCEENDTVQNIGLEDTMTNNDGTVIINDGILTNNNNFVRENYGTVTNNYGEVNENHDTVTTNGTLPESETAAFDANAIVYYNYGTVTTNNGVVNANGTENNHDNAVVGTNNGYVKENKGTITANENDVYSNYGAVNTNNGTITANENDVYSNYGAVNTNNGTVNTNGSSGTVGTNSGTVGTKNGNVGTNNGNVGTNNGNVYSNRVGAEVTNNKEGATVTYNYGTVITNDGTVTDNKGIVDTNSITGMVSNWEWEYGEGTVGTNYGTVNEPYGTTHYGVQVEGSLLQKDEGKDLDLTQIFTKAGYVLTGFIQNYGMVNGKVTQVDSPITVNSTSYTADCPNVLTLIWQAIVNPGSGSGSGENASAAGEIAAADDGAGYFGPGSHIAINGHQYLLVAVVEDVYCLASVESFEEEQLSDLPALLATLLTEDQLTHVTGEPELLDEELTARFFAGEGSHIVFPCDSSLIFS